MVKFDIYHYVAMWHNLTFLRFKKRRTHFLKSYQVRKWIQLYSLPVLHFKTLKQRCVRTGGLSQPDLMVIT